MTTGNLQDQLQLLVQSIQWTYIVHWSFCIRQGVLVWRDGYYNGAITTMKMMQPLNAVSTEEAEASLPSQRSRQLRELYESLSVGPELYGSARRPYASLSSLSPEDLNESEWFYLMCLSFSFPPNIDLPGKAFAEQRYVWLATADEADSKLFPRSILAKSAGMQTIVCIPFADCVLELGNTEKIEEDLRLIQHARSIFINAHEQQQDQNLSDNSTTSAAFFNSSPQVMMQHNQPVGIGQEDVDVNVDVNIDDTNSNEESEAEGGFGGFGGFGDSNMVMVGDQNHVAGVLEAENSLQLQMLDDIFPLSTPENWLDINTFTAPSDDGYDSYYSQTASTNLRNDMMMQMEWLSDNVNLPISENSAFSDWRINTGAGFQGTEKSQSLLKYILFTVPSLHTKPKDNNLKSQGRRQGQTLHKSRVQDDLGASHVVAERRRREKMNERFIILRSLIPFITKTDKASILGDTIEYVKLLRRQVEEFKYRQRTMEAEHISKDPETPQSQMCSLENSCSRFTAEEESARTVLQVSIIDENALLELQCPNREGLLLTIMQKLHQLLLEITSLQYSSTNHVFDAHVRAKVKANPHGKIASIVEVKKAIHMILAS